MPTLYDLNPHLRPSTTRKVSKKAEPKKDAAPKKRGRPKKVK